MAFIFKLACCFNCIFFLLSSLVREDVFSVSVSSGLGRWPWDRAGFQVSFARERGKEQFVWTGPVITLTLLLQCVRDA